MFITASNVFFYFYIFEEKGNKVFLDYGKVRIIIRNFANLRHVNFCFRFLILHSYFNNCTVFARIKKMFNLSWKQSSNHKEMSKSI